MEIYLVGGAVRDRLLGLPVKDRDWVVVGATPEQMVAQGFIPVGRDFPVFLHPTTKEEYALARTERKTARGYRGFAVHCAPEVTLEQDLARRDLTINAIAIGAHLMAHNGAFDVELDQLVDPYQGQRDLAAKLLRHVTEAFREDPVRILRVARFSARFTDFTVAPETLQLMRDMVQHGEVGHLVAERVWQELARGLMEKQPSRMLELLRACGALARLLPEVDGLWGLPQHADEPPEIDRGAQLMELLDEAARMQAPLAVRLACLTHDLGSTALLIGLCERLRVPTDCRELAELVAREQRHIDASADLDAPGVMRLLERCDAVRQAHRFALALWACECQARARSRPQHQPYAARARLQCCLNAALAVATEPIARQAQSQGISGPAIGALIHAARVNAVHRTLE